MDIFIDVMYGLDLFLNFFMAYEDQDKKIEVRIKKIFHEYFTGWFIVDFLAVVPF